MKKAWKKILSFVLVVSLIMTSSISALAIDGEEYLCELRLVYAEDSDEARDILDDGEFYEYELLEENLNEGTDEIGVFLAYKTTTDIEDAITDIAVMQMGGGYNEGNYQEMVKQSYDAYVEMGKTYLTAIDYFMEGYESGHYLSKAAYRQLNFFTVVDEEVDYNDMRFGDVLAAGLSAQELATIFMEGNSYALKNIRSLISMGVSYNADGKTYLKKVEASAAEMTANPTVFNRKNYNELAKLVAATIPVFKDMFKELACYEAEIDYTDDVTTEIEVTYAEHQAIAEMMRGTKYLNNQTLYQFCLDYDESNTNLSVFYPLVDALNEGQVAMTKAAHFYDVVRYSTSSVSEEALETLLKDAEVEYGENPFDIYTGVDRSVFDGSFALTSDAYRNDVSSETKLADAYFGNTTNAVMTGIHIASGVIGIGLFVATTIAYKSANAATTAYINDAVASVAAQAKNITIDAMQNIGAMPVYWSESLSSFTNYDAFLTHCIQHYSEAVSGIAPNVTNWSFNAKYQFWNNEIAPALSTKGSVTGGLETNDYMIMQSLDQKVGQTTDWVTNNVDAATNNVQQTGMNMFMQTKLISAGLYLVAGALMLYSAVSLAITAYNYYNPDYDDIPLSMVDLINTVDGDRYIKYDVVYEAESRDGEGYAAGDLNAFEAKRWNALYYTKSYEAGKPLLAEFELSNDNNVPDDGFAPVRRFGEVICYDLNRYNFDYDSEVIYLSVEQSEYNKMAVTGVPDLIGSIFSSGWALLAGGIGLLVGVGGTICTRSLFKRKKVGVKEEEKG